MAGQGLIKSQDSTVEIIAPNKLEALRSRAAIESGSFKKLLFQKQGSSKVGSSKTDSSE